MIGDNMVQHLGGAFGPIFIWTKSDYDAMMNMMSHIMNVQQQNQVLLSRVLNQEKHLMSALDDLTAQVRANTDVEQSAVTLIQGIAAELQNAVSNNDSAALQDLAQKLQASATALGEAIAANTPAEGGGGEEPAPAPAPQAHRPRGR